MPRFKILPRKAEALGSRYPPLQFATSFHQIAWSIRLALLDRAPAGRSMASPVVHSLVTPGGVSRSWSRLRMEVIHRHGGRCCRCGCFGDEITLQVYPGEIRNGHQEALVPLCTRCQAEPAEEAIARVAVSLTGKERARTLLS